MKAVLGAAARAAGDCLHPRVLGWSLLPLLLGGTSLGLLGWLFWEDAIDAARAGLAQGELLQPMLDWLDGRGLQGLRSVLAPLVVVALALPLLVLAALLLVALLVLPATVRHVAARRFAGLQPRHGASRRQCLGRGLLAMAVALLLQLSVLALMTRLPPAFVAPAVLLAVVLAPLSWGWLCMQVLAFGVLALHASACERRELLRRHRLPVLAIGLACGCLAAAPALVWAPGMAALVLAPLLAPLALWLGLLVFAFACAWYAHYLLARLQALRASVPIVPASAVNP